MSAEKSGNGEKSSSESEGLPPWLRLVWQHVDTLKFGAVQITVHDSQVTQVERLEKTRLDRPK